MSRRDTILISVLVNMALLIALFVFALQPKAPIEIAKVNLQPIGKIEKLQVVENKASLDQVDNLLSKFVADEVKSQVEIAQHTTPQISEPQLITDPNVNYKKLLDPGD